MNVRWSCLCENLFNKKRIPNVKSFIYNERVCFIEGAVGEGRGEPPVDFGCHEG